MVTGIQMRLVSRLAGVVALPCPGGGLGVGGCVVASWVPPHHHTPTAPHHPLLQGGLCLVQHILPILQPLNLLLLLLGLLALPITNETHGRVFASPPSHALHQGSPRVFTALHTLIPFSCKGTCNRIEIRSASASCHCEQQQSGDVGGRRETGREGERERGEGGGGWSSEQPPRCCLPATRPPPRHQARHQHIPTSVYLLTLLALHNTNQYCCLSTFSICTLLFNVYSFTPISSSCTPLIPTISGKRLSQKIFLPLISLDSN